MICTEYQKQSIMFEPARLSSHDTSRARSHAASHDASHATSHDQSSVVHVTCISLYTESGLRTQSANILPMQGPVYHGDGAGAILKCHLGADKTVGERVGQWDSGAVEWTVPQPLSTIDSQSAVCRIWRRNACRRLLDVRRESGCPYRVGNPK